MIYKFHPETKFTIGCDDMGQLFDDALALRILLASFVRDSTRPKVDEIFAMMTRAANSVEILKSAIKEQIPEAEIAE